MKIGSKMEQYVVLAKTAKGKSLEMLIQEVLSSSEIWNFGELLNMDAIKMVLNSYFIAKKYSFRSAF